MGQWNQWEWLAAWMGFWGVLILAQFVVRFLQFRSALASAVPGSERGLSFRWPALLAQLWSLLLLPFVLFIAFRAAGFLMGHVSQGGFFYWTGVVLLGIVFSSLSYHVLEPPDSESHPPSRTAKELVAGVFGVGLLFLFDAG